MHVGRSSRRNILNNFQKEVERTLSSATTTSIFFDKGTIVVRGGHRIPNTVWDERIGAFRAQAIFYRDMLQYFKESDLEFQDNVASHLIPCPHLECVSTVKLRGYQKKALSSWERSGKRGTIVLPTGAGKTVIAIKAIELVNQPALVVVPTLDLMEQWRKRIEKELSIKAGVLGGGESTLLPVTVSTYDSAFIKAPEIGAKFSFIIADEVHHIASEGYRQIAEMFSAPYRMGLTATLEREDMLHKEIPRLIGGVVFRLEPRDLAGSYLSNFSVDRIVVDLTEEEMKEYEKHHRIFTDYIQRNRIRLFTPMSFRRFIMRSARDPEARKALLARNRSMDIAFNSESKIKELEKILIENPEERILIFTQHNDLVYRISRRFLIPFITHTTNKEERHQVLEKFNSGVYRAVVTSKVLDEGIDVPEASLGVILSGSGSSREFIQRLGRLLRKSSHKEEARLVEIISRETSEVGTSSRRRKKSKVAIAASSRDVGKKNEKVSYLKLS
jgi:superfamily II DNA or RNA helicase